MTWESNEHITYTINLRLFLLKKSILIEWIPCRFETPLYEQVFWAIILSTLIFIFSYSFVVYYYIALRNQHVLLRLRNFTKSAFYKPSVFFTTI